MQVGVLTRNITDDGRGKARAIVFHHKHEKETGRSSAITTEIMVRPPPPPLPPFSGWWSVAAIASYVKPHHAALHYCVQGFTDRGPLEVDAKASRAKIWQSVRQHADRVLTFVDLCGHEAYLKTASARRVCQSAPRPAPLIRV
jgi:GTPase